VQAEQGANAIPHDGVVVNYQYPYLLIGNLLV